MRHHVLLLLTIGLFSCAKKDTDQGTPGPEKYRPVYHFTPKKNWINDPNGLVFYDGEYHLFYQYNPYGTTSGHISWGHAVSKDLLTWQHLPIALGEYLDPVTKDSTMIFSGTAVIDNNTSALCSGKDCMIAIYTSNLHRDNQGLRQHQSLAYSNDKGRTWTRYDKNPILDIQRKDFRDPKVFWYEPQQKWVMALVIPDVFKVRFYESKNLIDWKQLSEFGPLGDTTRIWECPDLYPLNVEGQPGNTRWVLSLSGGHPQGSKFVGMQYFVGQFDGTRFTPDDPKQPVRYVDHGKDFYAGIVYNNIPAEDGRTLMVGWINNWTYANLVPTSTWRGAMSIPRELSLKKIKDSYFLIQKPLTSITSLRKNEIEDLTRFKGGSFEIEMEASGEGTLLELFANENEKTVIGIKDSHLFVDRRQSGIVNFHPDFPSVDQVKIKEGPVRVRIFADQSIVEVYINDGESVITSQVFPTGDYTIQLPAKEKIRNLKAWSLASN